MILVDAKTGRVLYKKNDLERRAVASTQKLLTALIVAEEGDLSREVEISESDASAPPTKLGVSPGQKYSRAILLSAMLVRSANDAARALARDNAGSVEAFVEKMNAKARAMGATSSNFENPNGLPSPGQHSTARDIAIIARNAYANPIVRELVSVKAFRFRFDDGRERELVNTNRVLSSLRFCNGMKTGFTSAAGHCLVSSASTAGRDVIAVILGSDKKRVATDSKKLLEWGLGI